MDILRDISVQRLDELYSVPLALLTSMGMILVGGYFKENASTLTLILGSIITIAGSSSLAYLFSVDKMGDKLREKLNNIYATMGEDFKQEVKREQINQIFGFPTEQKTR